MATIAISAGTPGRRSGRLLVLALLAIVGVVFGSLVGHVPGRDVMPPEEVMLPELTEHAALHADAQASLDGVRHHGAYCRYDCPDGRTRFVCGMADGRWAVVVLGGTQRLITAFTADQDYARGIIDGCRNPWRFVHP